MASSGPLSAGTGANDAAIGTVAWTNPGRVTADDSVRSSASPSAGSVTNYLKATNFGFAIPTGATIDGIVATWELRQIGGSTPLSSFTLVKAGSATGTAKTSTDAWTTLSFGSSSDLWGATWSVSDINDTGFGTAMSANNNTGGSVSLQVDYVSMTVYYTEGGSSSIATKVHHYRQQGCM